MYKRTVHITFNFTCWLQITLCLLFLYTVFITHSFFLNTEQLKWLIKFFLKPTHWLVLSIIVNCAIFILEIMHYTCITVFDAVCKLE